ncbi:YbaB/EbfC family nucleoid-associated protein [Rubripirellula amarantea]|uniref:Nucleoid-associated protein n=1 Tax=Rubripirellula amarantea TaxID=2527999 RepID=A0A5C5WMY3_9BACT|nr:YbaB/EbfC family nucleoid-associated protein [Rubripirellula amarantea]MDA8743342.1 YbaB/EbfC family nucleoid-associated protein [Rubripirellula amarantea]TWT51363.1 Nucleoid-associated protein [Rubripirellula amarantea]
MFKGLGNLGNIASMMGSLQSLPQKLEELNERMKSETVTASSGCGRVTVSMNGVGHVQSLKVDPELQGAEMEEAIVDATNAAGAAAKQLFASAMSHMTQEMDLNLPGMDNILSSLTGGG